MKRLIFFFTLFLLAGKLWAQQDSILVSGIVMSADSMKYLKGTHFVINNKHAGTTDATSKFTILLIPNDTIRFTHIGYRPVQFVTPDSLRQRSYVLGIFMRKDTVDLPEVIVMPRSIINQANLESETKRKLQEMNNLKTTIAHARYQAATYQPKEWDAEMNQNFMMQKFKNEYLYAGQIAPSETLNFLALIPFTYHLLSGRLFPDPPPVFRVNAQEESKLKLYFEEQIRLRSTLEKTIR